MEYVDRKQGIVLTDEDIIHIMDLEDYIYPTPDKIGYQPHIARNCYLNGLTVKKLKTEYADMPLKWIIELFS